MHRVDIALGIYYSYAPAKLAFRALFHLLALKGLEEHMPLLLVPGECLFACFACCHHLDGLQHPVVHAFVVKHKWCQTRQLVRIWVHDKRAVMVHQRAVGILRWFSRKHKL